MKIFFKKTESDIFASKQDEREFNQFHNTYQIITFAMCVSMIYPNPGTVKLQLICTAFVLTSVMPIATMIVIDMYRSWTERDMINIIRHSTVLGPFIGSFAKTFLMLLNRKQGKGLIDEIDRDYALYNDMPEAYKSIVRSSIKNCLVYSETCWVITVLTCVLTFPVMAIVQTFYNFIFKSEPVKYMVHDLNKPFSDPEERFESPYFEIMFAYMIYCSLIYVINFTGYDGFFGLCINHACLKMDIYCMQLQDAMRAETDGEVREKVCKVIDEQCRMFEFIDRLQETFNIWLGIIFVATMIQICTCLYHITEGYGFDLRYMIFIVGAVIHIYLPCRYAAKLKSKSLETSTHFYCSGWENVNNQVIRKMIIFMIARAQVPNEITAFNMLAFDMELFVSILQTSYSMFTLLKS